MSNQLQPHCKLSTVSTPLTFREFGAVLAAVRSHPEEVDLNDIVTLVLCTGLGPAIIRGLRWDDVHLSDALLLARSARVLHTSCIPLGKDLIAMLRKRHARHPDDDFVVSAQCLIAETATLEELSQKGLRACSHLRRSAGRAREALGTQQVTVNLTAPAAQGSAL